MSADVQYPPRTEAERGAVEALVQAWGRLVHGLGTATGVQLDAGRSAAALAAATLAMALTLTLVQSLLFAPGGQGVEDFLGWAGPEGEAAASALLRWWDDNGLRPFAWLYLGADTLLFMPIYGACFLTLALRLANGLCDDDPLNLSAHERWVLAGLAGPVLALLAVDLLENTLGLARMGVWAGVGGLVAAALCLRLLLALQAWRRLWGNAPAAAGERAAGRAPMKADRRAGAVAAGLALLALAGAWGSGGCGSAGLADFGAWWGPLGCAAHGAKQWLVALVLVLLMASGAIWFFGIGLRADRTLVLDDVAGPPAAPPPAEPPGAPAPATEGGAAPPMVALVHARRGEREQLRAAVGDMLLRSRYVLIALALMAVLTVGMDQGRDVVYAMAASPYRQQLAQPIDRLWLALGALAAFGATAVALWLFAFACWLWTRSVCQIRTVRTGGLWLLRQASGAQRTLRPPPEPMVERFAQLWARCLAGVPVVVMVWLCAGVMRDSVAATVAGALDWRWPVLTLGAFGLLALLLGGVFMGLRSRAREHDTHYYDALSWAQWAQRVGLRRDLPLPAPTRAQTDKFRFARRINPRQLPLLLAAGLLLARAVDVLPPGMPWQGDLVPSLVLPVILFSLALWLCFFGWLSLLEVQHAIPWVLLLVAVIGALGAIGLTVNHVVWPALAPREVVPPGLLQMFGFSALLLLLAMLGYLWALRWAMPSSQRRWPPAPGRRDIAGLAAGLLLVLAFGLLLAWGDRAASVRTPAAPMQVLPAQQRPSVDAALAGWLGALCGPGAAAPAGAAAAAPCTPPVAPGARGPQGQLPVFLVSTEGGGIRAAVWTAFVLQRLSETQPDFLARTFSVSGVSGGAVGAAVFRACGDEPAARRHCLRTLAGTDLLAPLLSAWMLEDATARVLPTAWCSTPACGFLSRGAWFEQALELGAPGLRQGLIASGQAPAPGRPASAPAAGPGQRPHAGRPYLLLNSTWVESGERAINSDLQIDWRQFGGARDTLGLTGRDMPLATAAHNAARFPFINAIGALRAPHAACQARLPGAPVPAGADEASTWPVCGHLADGGYFDNSGAQTTRDLLHALERCLLVQAGDEDAALYPRCAALPAPQRQWLRAHLVPQVLMLRNSARPAEAQAPDCDALRDDHRPDAAALVPPKPGDCLSLNADRYHPERPRCRARNDLYVDLLGPALAVLNVSGIGANGLLAEAHQVATVQLLRQRLGGLAATRPAGLAGGAPVAVLDLLPDGVRYPLGWHLSAAAVEGMERQADGCLR